MTYHKKGDMMKFRFMIAVFLMSVLVGACGNTPAPAEQRDTQPETAVQSDTEQSGEPQTEPTVAVSSEESTSSDSAAADVDVWTPDSYYDNLQVLDSYTLTFTYKVTMNGKEEKMKGMNRAIEDSYKDDKDKMAIVKNNTGVYYSNFPVGSSDTRGKQVSSASGYFSEAKEMANSHVLKYYIDRNLYSREKVYIYYYDPITDYRPRNIELNIEFRRPYFNPQVPIEISQMETFNVQDISSEECTDVKRKKVGKKRELTWWDLYRIEDVDDGVHCPLQDKK
jgi:hypothetical protein